MVPLKVSLVALVESDKEILSPLFLFCIAEEVLSRGLTKLKEDGRIKPISSPRGCSPPPLTLCMLMIFLFFAEASLRNLLSFLHKYEASSGQVINTKTRVTFTQESTPFMFIGRQKLLRCWVLTRAPFHLPI